MVSGEWPAMSRLLSAYCQLPSAYCSMDYAGPLNRSAPLQLGQLGLALASSITRLLPLSSLKLAYTSIPTNSDRRSEVLPAWEEKIIGEGVELSEVVAAKNKSAPLGGA